MYGVIAEDSSDVEVLQILIRRMSHNIAMPIKSKGYNGCGEMLRKGAKQLNLFSQLGGNRFIICYDADGPHATPHHNEILDEIVKPASVNPSKCLALVPVQEIEAWLLADIDRAVPHVIKSWKPAAIPNPEAITSPKEYLIALSRGSNKKPRYAYTIHNQQVAKYLDIVAVQKKCASFRPLHTFVVKSRKLCFPAAVFPGRKHALFAYTGDNKNSEYIAQQVATTDAWGRVTNFVQESSPYATELVRLCEYGWANLAKANAEISTILGKAEPNARIRAILKQLQQIAKNSKGAFIGLDDGTR